jgi:hypothetical protein
MSLLDATSYIELLAGVNAANIGLKSLRDLFKHQRRRLNINIQRNLNTVTQAHGLLREQGFNPERLSLVSGEPIENIRRQAEVLFEDYNKLIERLIYWIGVISTLTLGYSLFCIGIHWDNNDSWFSTQILWIANLVFFGFLFIVFSSFSWKENHRKLGGGILAFILTVSIFKLAMINRFIGSHLDASNHTLYCITIIGLVPILNTIVASKFLEISSLKIIKSIEEINQTISTFTKEIMDSRLNQAINVPASGSVTPSSNTIVAITTPTTLTITTNPPPSSPSESK